MSGAAGRVKNIAEASFIKAQLLAEGVRISRKIKKHPNYKKKLVHLYKHEAKDFKADFPLPQEIILFKHPHIPKRSIVTNIRGNPRSPWLLDYQNDSLILISSAQTVLRYLVDFPPNDNFDRVMLRNEISVANITSKIGANVLGFVVSNYCSYFGYGKQCKFCEIVPSYHEYKNYFSITKDLSLVALAAKRALTIDPNIRYIIATSGNLPGRAPTDTYDKTVRMYIKLFASLKPLKKKHGLRFHAALLPPLDLNLFYDLKESGVDSICCNLEVYNRKLFEYVCPGKSEYGYERMLKALEFAAKVFDKGCVLSNLVYGIQSVSANNTKKKFNSSLENKINGESMQLLLNIGTIPFYTIYHYGGYNQIGPINIDPKAMYDFYLSYGDSVLKSNIVPDNSDVILFDLFSLPNQLNNEGYFINKFKEDAVCKYH